MEFGHDTLGEIEVSGDLTIIDFRRLLNHPIDQVWSAITKPEEIAKWWGEAIVDLEKGVYFVRRFDQDGDGNGGTERPEMHALITVCDAPSVLQIDGDLHGRLHFQLEADGPQTKLSFFNIVGIPDEHQSMEMTRWHFHMDSLSKSLNGEVIDLANTAEVLIPLHNRYLRSPRQLRSA